ncbi:MAG: AAA family ATPase, partial [Roseovarius confluentis]
MTVLNMRGEWRLDKGMFAVTGRNGLDTFFAKPGDRFYHRKLKKTGTVVRLEKLCQWDFLTESWVWREYLDPVANDTAYARIRMHWDGEPNDYGDDCEVEDVQNLIGEGAEPLPLTGRAGQIQAAMRPLKENEPVLESRYIVEGLLDRGAFSTAYGAPGSGKTFAMLEMAIHVAARREWRGLRVGGQDTEYDWPGPVVYIALEGGRGIRNRLAALKIEKPDVFAAAAEDDMFTAISLPLDFHAEGDAEALLEVF